MKPRMPGFKDSAIKLFGKTIPLSVSLTLQHHASSAIESCSGPDAACHDRFDLNTTTSLLQETKSQDEWKGQGGNLETSIEVLTDDKQEDGTSNQVTEDKKDPTTSGVSESPKTPSVEGETSSLKSSKNGEQSDSSVSPEKTLKKPDKILPCPRCNSMETKFCYYNNYNVNQPRHFCKNCQRYWTAGGTMRNVPVGAGRRKNKSSPAAQYRHHIMVPEALRSVQANGLNGVQSHSLGNNTTVLTFGSDSPLCESVASVLSISGKTCNAAGDVDDQSNGSARALNSSIKGGNGGSQEAVAIQNCQGFPPQLRCFPGPAWPCPWTSTMPPPNFGPSGFPVSFYSSPPYWGCAVPSPWNVSPCLPPPSPTLNHCARIGRPTCPLGKHSRDGEMLNPAYSEEPSRESNSSDRNVFVPKTLRIDDPSEAAKSSIRATLGIKGEKSKSVNGGGLFKGFQTECIENCQPETSSFLKANPAALSRSLNFHETLKESFH